MLILPWKFELDQPSRLRVIWEKRRIMADALMATSIHVFWEGESSDIRPFWKDSNVNDGCNIFLNFSCHSFFATMTNIWVHKLILVSFGRSKVTAMSVLIVTRQVINDSHGVNLSVQYNLCQDARIENLFSISLKWSYQSHCCFQSK